MIYKTEKLQRNEYLFYEKISFLYIPFSFSYKVELRETEENKLVYMYSKVQPGVYLELRFELNGTGNTTEVREEISIKAPLGIRQIFAGILKRAHLRFFDTIRSME